MSDLTRLCSLILTWALGLAVCASSWAQAAPAAGTPELDAALATALAAEEELEYEQAHRLWLEIISRDDLDEEQRIDANLHAGSVARVLGRDVEARSHFVYVLSRRPDYLLPDETAPRVRHFFELIRQELASEREAVPPPPPPPTAEQLAAEPGAAPAGGDRTLLWVGAGVAGLGLLTAAGGGVLGALASAEHEQALAAEVQLVQEDHYQARDGLALAANIGFAAAGVMALGGGALVALGLASGGGE